MVNIQPFRAIHYQKDPANVITRPYDVISQEQQDRYYEMSPYNFIRIDYGKSAQDDDDQKNRYQRSAQYLTEWLKTGVMAKTKEAGIYIYRQRFQYEGQDYTRFNFFALCELVLFEDQLVLPHEKTMDAPKTDRLNLMKATRANLSPIFSIYADRERQIEQWLQEVESEQKPYFQYMDEEQIEHSLWFCMDQDLIHKVQQWFRGQQLFIADGHHRYETALNYRNMQHEAGEHSPSVNFVMMCLTNIYDPSLLILPTHRLLTDAFELPSKEVFMNALGAYFQISALPSENIEDVLPQHRDKTAIGMYLDHEYFLLLREKGLPSEILAQRSLAYGQLDVAVLQDLIFEKILNFPYTLAKDSRYIRYSPDIAEMQLWTQKEWGQLAFFLNPLPVEELCDVALAQDTMPPKSTYFYPKVPSGMVVYPFD